MTINQIPVKIRSYSYPAIILTNLHSPMQLFRKRTIDEIEKKSLLSREDLLRRSRILFIDDERPDLIDDLTQSGFSVDYQPDITKENSNVIERLTYDLIILDFGNVGRYYGPDEGLSLLRHIKRVNPTANVVAYTSKMLGTGQSDFYRMADGVLSKDAGIQESMEKIEEWLKIAHSTPNLWKGLLTSMDIAPGSKDDLDLQNLYVRGLSKDKNKKAFIDKVKKVLGSEGSKKIGIMIAEKLIEYGAKAVVGV